MKHQATTCRTSAAPFASHAETRGKLFTNPVSFQPRSVPCHGDAAWRPGQSLPTPPRSPGYAGQRPVRCDEAPHPPTHNPITHKGQEHLCRRSGQDLYIFGVVRKLWLRIDGAQTGPAGDRPQIRVNTFAYTRRVSFDSNLHCNTHIDMSGVFRSLSCEFADA